MVSDKNKLPAAHITLDFKNIKKEYNSYLVNKKCEIKRLKGKGKLMGVGPLTCQ